MDIGRLAAEIKQFSEVQPKEEEVKTQKTIKRSCKLWSDKETDDYIRAVKKVGRDFKAIT